MRAFDNLPTSQSLVNCVICFYFCDSTQSRILFLLTEGINLQIWPALKETTFNPHLILVSNYNSLSLLSKLVSALDRPSLPPFLD